MDVDLAQVITAIGKNKSLKHLYMGRNTIGMKSKHIAVVMDALVQMIQENDCVLQSLYLPDSRLKADIYCLINALGSNGCLHSLDISGNQMGDPGARLLAKALQINNHLKTIIYDKNNITLSGYADIVHALEKLVLFNILFIRDVRMPYSFIKFNTIKLYYKSTKFKLKISQT